MGVIYFGNKTNTALSVTTDAVTFIVPATCAGKLKMFNVYGFAAASAANEIVVARSSGGVTSSSLITPNPQSALTNAAAITVAQAWATQPTLGAVMARLGVNANGGGRVWSLPPGLEIDMAPSSTLSVRSISGTSLVIVEFAFEQIG